MTATTLTPNTPPDEMPTAVLVEHAAGIVAALASGAMIDMADLACLGHALDRLRLLAVAAEAPAASDAHLAGMREGLLLGAAEQTAKDLALAERLVDAIRSEHRIATLSTRRPQPTAAPAQPPSLDGAHG